MAWPWTREVEMRILDAIDNGPGGGAKVRISAEDALGVMAVFAAIRVISEDVAKLPAALKRETTKGVEVATGEPEHRMLSRLGKAPSDVDDGFTAMEWIEAIVANAAFEGRGVAHLNRVAGKAHEITPIPRGSWREEAGKWEIMWESGRWEQVSRSDLLVLRGPQLGANVTQFARHAIDLAQKLDKLMIALARKGGRASGIISTEKLNSKDKAERLIERIKKYFGPQGDGGVMPLDLGQLHYQRLSLSPEELQQDETYSRVVKQIASAYRVQPTRLMLEMTEQNNASAYQWNIAHVTDTVQPWSKRFCQSFDKDVLGKKRVGEGFYCDVELKGLLRGSPKERAEFLLKLRTMAALSPRTVAELEDMPTDGLSNDPAHPLLTNPNPEKETEKEGDDETDGDDDE